MACLLIRLACATLSVWEHVFGRRGVGVLGKANFPAVLGLWLEVGFSKSFGNGRVAVDGARAAFVPISRWHVGGNRMAC